MSLHRRSLQAILSITLALLPTLTVSFRARRKADSPTEPHVESLASFPVHRQKSIYALDCWQKRPVTRHAVLSELGEEINKTEWGPGAGMNPSSITPFQTVIKDGFFEMACAKDYLYNHGDKFGDNRLSYAVMHTENISIVRYSRHVSTTEAEPMTHEVCFNFCRTIPEMLTFGITRGHECYCAPFFKPMESDSSICDVVCEGNPSQMCGGTSKSTVFEMHRCADTRSELNETGSRAAVILPRLAASLAQVTELKDKMQNISTELQTLLSRKGDSAAAALMQSAKVTAGDLSRELSSAQQVYDDLSASTATAAGLTGTGLTVAQTLEAERVEKTMTTLIGTATDHATHLEADIVDVHPAGPGYNASVNASQQYLPLMHFVNDAYSGTPTTCSGIVIGHPKVDVTVDECAYACDHLINECAGFSSYHGGPVSLCFLFRKFTGVSYYTACNAALLGNRPSPTCMAKMHKFQGTNIAPDPSGRCDMCLEQALDTGKCITA